jgi:hypothetical protein
MKTFSYKNGDFSDERERERERGGDRKRLWKLIKTIADISPSPNITLSTPHTATTPTHDSKPTAQHGKYLLERTCAVSIQNSKETSEDQAALERNASNKL